jgi:hypothetical protein
MVYILDAQDLSRDGDVTVAVVKNDVLVAVVGFVPEDHVWVLVEETGDVLDDPLWGALPLCEVLH